MTAARPLHVGLIGAGIGRQHLDGYLQIEDRMRVSVICDLDLERASVLAGRRDYIRVEQDFERVLQNTDIDIVDICLPPDLHYPFSVRAIEAGKHVICEKPLVTSVAEADLLIEKASAAGICFSPVLQYRYGRATAEIDALKHAGLIGKPIVASIETHWNRGEKYYATPWRGTWKSEAGGAVLSHAIHNNDLIYRIFGNVESLFAYTATRVNPIETEDCAAIAMRMGDGALATSSITLGAAENTSRLRFVFEDLTIESSPKPYAPCDGKWSYTARNPDKQQLVDAVIASVENPLTGYAHYFSEFADAIEGKPNSSVTLLDGKRSLEFAAAVYHSSRTGQPVNLPIGKDHPCYNGWRPNEADEVKQCPA